MTSRSAGRNAATRALVRSPRGRTPKPRTWRYPYTPHPGPQTLAHELDYVDELLYGGAAGGGKTEFLIAEVLKTLLRWGDWAQERDRASKAAGGPGFAWRPAGVIFRSSFPELNLPSGVIPRLLSTLPQPAVGRYRSTDHEWTFANGAVLTLAYLERDADVARYLGGEYAILAFDQVEQITEWAYRLMQHRLRVPAEVVEAGLTPRTISTANPIGPGVAWLKGRFVDPAPPHVVWKPAPTEDDPAPGLRCFIPAKLTDNPSIGPDYFERLQRLPPDERRALLEGDWDVMQGARFRDFRRDVHVIDPEEFPIPLGGRLVKAMGIDYGYDAPFAALWGALFADGLVVVYRELYKAGLTPFEQARAILAAERPGERSPERPIVPYLDPSTWARALPRRPDLEPPGPEMDPPLGSIAREYVDAGVPVTKAENNRLLGVARVADALRVRGDGRPRLLIYSTCRNLIRTLPMLPRDPRRPEDVDTRAEDHAYDALRYLLVALGAAVPAPPESPVARARARAAQARARGGPAAGIRKAGFYVPDRWAA